MPQLSEHTRTFLKQLAAPVEIRFYALLDPETAPISGREFAGRVNALLSEYASASGGKVTVVRLAEQSESAAKAASADRIKPFNLDRGDACYLGLALSCQGRSESLPQLAPEWEQALESDVTRAIQRLLAPPVTTTQPGAEAQPGSEVLDEVRSLIPNLASVSVEDGTQILREKALKSFAEAAKEMQARVQEAQKKLAQARNGGSQTEQQAALQQFQKVQSEQAENLKSISARLATQVESLEYLKKH